ncbi:MAG: hypothetical protein AB1750_07600 [Chloroflexota bacterium]
MNVTLPKTISGWCMWLFFLWFGVGTIWTGIPDAAFDYGTGILAIAYAVFAFFGK